LCDHFGRRIKRITFLRRLHSIIFKKSKMKPNRIFFYIAGVIFVLAAMVLQSSTNQAGQLTSYELIYPPVISRDSAGADKYIVPNLNRPFKEDSTLLFHLEHVKSSGTDTAVFTLQASNFAGSLNLWDDVSTWTWTATNDTIIKVTDAAAYYRIRVNDATPIAFASTTRLGLKLAKQE
jgi:hypothetical protein